MPRSVAINVGANTSLPGLRGPIYPDGRFTYLPIPEREPTAEPVPTYADLAAELDLPFPIPEDLADRQVHLDPSFREYPLCESTTYGDEHGVKAGPISELAAGDYLLFYATLSTVETSDREWITPDWGVYLIGAIRLADDPVTGEQYRDLPPAERERYADNAHCKRETFDARVLVRGDPADSGLFERAVPLSAPDGGATANPVVTELAGDSGRGPWWRRVLRFDPAATDALLDLRTDPGGALAVG
ncbi:hypothetical protein BRC81_08630 [Halobacteriales archaeon QS_1_68_20]|nr:MAG: hypothetical protein BRC81_08630 [Halobacteriales archaeon QS_1_68_20]